MNKKKNPYENVYMEKGKPYVHDDTKNPELPKMSFQEWRRRNKEYQKNFIPERKLMDLVLVKRRDWGALPVGTGTPQDPILEMKYPVDKVLANYTRGPVVFESKECERLLQAMQKTDMERGLHDIRYNFLICPDGKVYEGRGWYVSPYKNPNFEHFYGEIFQIAHVGLHCKMVPNYMAKVAYDMIIVGLNEGYVHPKWQLHIDQVDAEKDICGGDY